MNCKVCRNTTTNTPGIPFFRFPKEGKKCQKWAELCRLKCSYMKKGPIQFNKSFRICSDHFDADEMMHDGRKVRLFPLAEPKFLLNKYRKVKKKKNKAVLKKFNAARVTLPNHYCRLCAEEKNNIVSIFGWRGKTMYDLEKKLKYFPFAIEKCDVLPLGVCQDCMVKVDQFVEFVETCIKAQIKLKDLLNNKIDNVTVQLVDPVMEILANSLLLPTQKTSAEQTQTTRLNKSQTINGGEEQTQSVNEVQNIRTDKAQIQGVKNPQNTGSGGAQSFDVTQSTSVNKALSQSIFETQGTGVSEAQNTNVDATQEINKEISQLLNGDKTLTIGVNETQIISCAITSQSALDIPENNYVHFNEITLPELYESLMNGPIENKTQAEQNYPEPVPDLMKLSDEDLITLYGANDNDLTLHKDPNLFITYSDVPTYDQFAPSQMMDHTAIINTNFDNIQTFSCDICLKEFATSEMLSSHLKAHCVQSNNDNFEKCTALDFFPDFNEGISKKAKELDWGINVSNNEPQGPLKVDVKLPELPQQEKKSSLKGRKKVRKKVKPQCEFCEKMFPTLDECQEHEKTHQGIQRYVCLQCKKTYRSKRGLRRHFPVHSGETFPCPKCETIFRRRDSLLNHKRVHQRFTCKLCNFVSKQKAELLKHEKDHELPVDLPTKLYDVEQANKELSESSLTNLISERDLPVPEALDEFLAATDTIQSTCIAVSNEFTPMDDIEQIVANRLIAMEI